MLFCVFTLFFLNLYSQNSIILKFKKDTYTFCYNKNRNVDYLKFKLKFTNNSKSTCKIWKPLLKPFDVSTACVFDINYPYYIYKGLNFEMVLINNELDNYNDTIIDIKNIVVIPISPILGSKSITSNNKTMKLRKNSSKNTTLRIPYNNTLPKGEYYGYIKINSKNTTNNNINICNYSVISDTVMIVIR